MPGTVGIIANPASGKDIRRLVAHASVFNNYEKVSIVRRAMAGLAAAGVDRVLYMPDTFHICTKAAAELDPPFVLEPITDTLRADALDTVRAAAAIEAAGAAAILSLGGDGTNRAIAKGTRNVPIVALSTGTNNVFPSMIEGTVAGLAAGAIAAGAADPAEVAPRCKWIELAVDGIGRDVALIDVVVMTDGFVASRAIWQIDRVREVILTRAIPDAVGMASLGGFVGPVSPEDDWGLHLTLGPGGLRVTAPIAPGLFRPVPIAAVRRLEFGARVAVAGPALFALDGEREFTIRDGEEASLYVTRLGPPVVDAHRCLTAAQEVGFLRSDIAAAVPSD